MKKSKILALVMALALLCGLFAGCGGSSKPAETTPATEAPAAEKPTEATAAPAAEEPAAEAPAEEPAAEAATDLPRNETLYFGGQQWGPINGWNPISPNMNNAMANSAAARGSRTVMFETLYMYNMLDGKL